jgi:hydroxymethylbilane synthase
MRLGTRGSALALAQAQRVAELLGGAEIVKLATSGDRHPAGPQDKSRWVDTIESALLAGEIDLAVHSAKDLPGELAEGLELLGVPAREGAEDVLCGVASLAQLPAGARVGTSSVRRRAQLLAAREDIDVVDLRGNVDTRLQRLAEAVDLDAIVLARAGLVRLGREQEIGGTLPADLFVPAPGQGALALEGRVGDTHTHEAAARLTHPQAHTCLHAERALARSLQADCHTPLGAHATISRDGLLLRCWIGLPDGGEWLADELLRPLDGRSESQDLARAQALASALAERLHAAGAAELLARAREMSAVA